MTWIALTSAVAIAIQVAGSVGEAPPSAPGNVPSTPPPLDWTYRPPPPSPPLPDWAYHPLYPPPPKHDDLATYYPDRAQRINAEGMARIACTVTEAGSLSDCVVVDESPPGLGFGESALKMAHLFKMKPKTVDGRPVGGARVVVPIRFKPHPVPPPAVGSAALKP